MPAYFHRAVLASIALRPRSKLIDVRCPAVPSSAAHGSNTSGARRLYRLIHAGQRLP